MFLGMRGLSRITRRMSQGDHKTQSGMSIFVVMMMLALSPFILMEYYTKMEPSVVITKPVKIVKRHNHRDHTFYQFKVRNVRTGEEVFKEVMDTNTLKQGDTTVAPYVRWFQ